MAWFDKILKRNSAGEAVPQYFNSSINDNEPLQGSNGSAFMQLTGSNVLKGSLQNVTTAGTRVQLPPYACREVTVISKDTNTGIIYAGGSDVSSTVYGVKLKRDGSFTFSVSNTNLIWIDASVSGDGVSYVAV